MSYVIGIAGVVAEAVAIVITVAATGITRVKSNASTDPTEKRALGAAAAILGISIILAIITLVFGFILALTKSCTKRARIPFFIFFGIFVAAYVTALVIIKVYQQRREKAGDVDGARDLQAAFILPLIAIGLYILGFILFYVLVGSRLKKLTNVCKQAKQFGIEADKLI